ncbi:MAG: protein kinase [Deltaproteobacteria bacterium]|nr:protein kinase [Deltaproteobacteria bacterium]
MSAAEPEAADSLDGPSDGPLDGLIRAAGRARPDEGLARTVARELVQAGLGLRDAPRVGRYVIDRRLGEGGMGTVFRAHDPELDRSVAIKIVHPEVDEDACGLLAKEARALARLSHPNVLVVHDVGTRDHRLWLAMEYIAGGTLREWRMAHASATWREIVALFVDAGRGLAAAHKAGVVHRDLKPDNVMIGLDGRVRVTDFGLAMVEGPPGGASPAPTPGGGGAAPIAGTPRYLPPEVARGEVPGPAGDQYSFFVALVEMLAPVGDEPAEALPPSLEALIAQGVAPAPADRMASMDEVVARLEALARAAPEDPRRAALLDRVQRMWLDGVLEAALEGRPATVLELREAPDLVDPPWRGLSAPRRAGPARHTTDRLRAELARAHGTLLLVGDVGAGKTTALLGLARALLERARRDPAEPAPVVLNLASLSSHRGSLMSWLVDELVVKYGLSRRRARAWLEEDALVLLLDGLDEVAAERRRAVAEAIDAFRSERPVSAVVACREDNYRALGVRLRFGLALRIEPPDPTTLAALCRAHGEAGEAALQRLLAHPEGPRPTPLVVSLLVRSGADARGDTDDAALGGAWGEVVERAMARPPPLVGAHRARLLAVVGWLARTLQRNGRSDLWLEQLQADWLERPAQRAAARTLGVLAMALVLLSGNLLGNVAAERPTVVGLLLGAFSIATVLVFNRGLRVHSGEALRWSWRLSLRRLPLLLALGLAVGLVFGALYVVWVNVALAVTVALVMSLVVGLEPRDREDRVRPGQGLWRAAQTGLIVGPTAGLLAGLAVGYLAVPLVLPHVGADSQLLRMGDPRASLFWSSAVFVALVTAFIYGWTAVVLHLSLRLVLAVTAAVPMRLTPWLDRAVDRGLLRRVGGGWMFQHRASMEHFARRPRSPT